MTLPANGQDHFPLPGPPPLAGEGDEVSLRESRVNSLLLAEKVSKHFGGLAALSEVSFSIRRGEIYGLIGPNGAGKTTLFNVLTGLYSLDGGQVKLDGHAIHGRKPSQVTALGLARTFQNIRLFA
ncbi:MAG: hypothetical protein C3F18_00910, partial [Nitrosomonadales bacterium]